MSERGRSLLERVRRRLSDDSVGPVLVVGDFILDRYCLGEVERISPEAPVPVLRVAEDRSNPGGAGNVVQNLAALGVPVLPAGPVGDDGEALLLKGHFEKEAIPVEGLLALRRPTPVKLRVMAARQQLIRLDREVTDEIDDDEESRLREVLEVFFLRRPSVIVLSDYGKGCCTPSLCAFLIAKARELGLPLVIDPKGADWERYRGASWVTPNLKELALVNGPSRLDNEDDTVAEAAGRVRRNYGLGRLLVTRSERGMTLVTGTGDGGDGRLHVRALAREVFDVSGAGDTVVAVLAAFIGGGFSDGEAVALANRAAGIVVGKVGTRPVTAAELLSALADEGLPEEAGRKIVSVEEALSRRQAWRDQGLKVVATNGCFDLLHPGHVSYLERARALGDRLVVALNGDNSVKAIKGPGRPVNDETVRARMMAALASVDLVCLFDEATPVALYERLRPDLLVKGGDYRLEDVLGRESAGEVQILPFEKGFSTTELIGRIRDAGFPRDGP